MLASLSLIFLVGLAMGAICGQLKLPRIIGMRITGTVGAVTGSMWDTGFTGNVSGIPVGRKTGLDRREPA